MVEIVAGVYCEYMQDPAQRPRRHLGRFAGANMLEPASTKQVPRKDLLSISA